ncbi:MAG: hypothetical protein IID34_09735 [Planctomycetes bacterium]|nr:hypothetical protein [Planctomycetota bacterium]
MIDEVEVSRFPFEAKIGSQACVITDPGYVSDVERLKFQGWSNGSNDVCITIVSPGDVSAIYRREFLLTISSQAREFRQTRWVPRGVPTLLSVPELVEERPGVRFLFEEWSGGEARFSTQNTIVLNRPITMEVRWSKEYLLELAGPEGVRLVGMGWHKEGTQVVLKAPETAFSMGDDERLQFSRWEVISNPAIVIPNRQQPSTSIRMDNTHIIQAVYDVEYRVTVDNPLGSLKNDWFDTGAEIVIETPAIIEIAADQVRRVFKSWEGADVDEAKGFIVAHEPRKVTAIYETEFLVKVNSPYGVTSGAGWYAEGEVARIRVPEKPSALFFLNRSFKSFDGYTTDGPLLELPVTGTVTITAWYTTSVDIQILGIIIAIAAAVGAIYLVSQREYNRRRRRSRW